MIGIRYCFADRFIQGTKGCILTIATHRQTALERQDLSRTNLAHHELESELMMYYLLIATEQHTVSTSMEDM